MKVAKKSVRKSAKKTPRAYQKALKISAKARYALRILADIASHEDEPRTETVIAECQNISMKFLSRIVVPLREAGFIASHRGSRDGFKLLKKPERITLLDILETMQGPLSVVDCLADPASCSRRASCATRRLWSKVNDAIRKDLASFTLADAL